MRRFDAFLLGREMQCMRCDGESLQTLLGVWKDDRCFDLFGCKVGNGASCRSVARFNQRDEMEVYMGTLVCAPDAEKLSRMSVRNSNSSKGRNGSTPGSEP
jgi:hypothetical protein